MTPLDPRLQAAIGELANALQTVILVTGHLRRDLQTATLVTSQLRRDLRAHVQEADTLHEAVSQAVTALRAVRKGVGL